MRVYFGDAAMSTVVAAFFCMIDGIYYDLPPSPPVTRADPGKLYARRRAPRATSHHTRDWLFQEEMVNTYFVLTR